MIYTTFTEKTMAEKDTPKEEIVFDLTKNEENNIGNSEIQEDESVNSVVIDQEIGKNVSNNKGTDD
jgi:hypothetical protein